MQLPTDEKLRAKVKNFLKGQNGDAGFEDFMSWFKSELQKRDEENRLIGFENQSSEAKGLADFVKIVAACQASEVDRDKSKSDAESESAGFLM